MATLEIVRNWFTQDLSPQCRRRRWAVHIEDKSPAEIVFRISTTRFIYSITAKPDWLGCTAETQEHKNGHPLFADLPDGQLSRETWQAIVEEIKRMELRPYRGPAI